MDLQQLSVKLFVASSGGRVDQSALIPIFHRWIREHSLRERVLVDVADYRHVHHGPGVMIIAHDAHYGLDEEAGEQGLLYSRKRDEIGPADEKLAHALSQALSACALLEAEDSVQPLAFAGDRVLVRVQSRLVADNSGASFAELEPHLAALAGRLYPEQGVDIRHVGDPRAPLSAEIRAEGDPGVEALRARLGA